jgi:hypothetical protein
LGRGESWECGANSDGEYQETSCYVQHLLLLGKQLGKDSWGKTVGEKTVGKASRARREGALSDRTESLCGPYRFCANVRSSGVGKVT